MKKILFPTDGSPAALLAATEAAKQFSGLQNIEVTVVLAVAYYDESEADFGEELVRQRNTSMKRRADAAVTETSAVFSAADILVTTKVIEGDPVSAAIANEAQSGGYDLIAMGSRGLSLEKEKLSYVGSVAQHLLRRVSIPVLVIPIHAVK